MSLIIDRVEQEALALESSVDLLLSIGVSLKEQTLTLGMALEADRLVGVAKGSFTRHHFDSSQDCKIALEEAEEGVWASIKAFFAKIGEWISKLLAWLGLGSDKPNEDTVEEATKATEEASSCAVELVQLVEEGQKEAASKPGEEKPSEAEPKTPSIDHKPAVTDPAQDHPTASQKAEQAPVAPPASIPELVEKYAEHLDIRSHLAAALIAKNTSTDFSREVDELAKQVAASMDAAITDVAAYEKSFVQDLARARKIGLSKLDVETNAIPEGAVQTIQAAIKKFNIATHPEEKAEYKPEKLQGVADAVKVLASAYQAIHNKLGALDPARKVKELNHTIEMIGHEIMNTKSSVAHPDENARAAAVCRAYMTQTRAALTYFSEAARAYRSITNLMRELKASERQLKRFFIQVVEQAASQKVRMGPRSADYKAMVAKWKRSMQLDTMVLSNK